MNDILIAGITIRCDIDGRYCLNDLHKASGGEARHRPNYWLENEQTKALVTELEIAGIPAIKSKQGLGTFAVKELVYAYAMWVSASFALIVIRAYDALVTGQIPPRERSIDDLLAEVHQRELVSVDKGKRGSALMHERRREKSKLEEVRRRLDIMIQPSLPGFGARAAS